tara:strand:+ start:18 stop:605 length:588 start_codon:yes stop_codon:yes gene_type:complete
MVERDIFGNPIKKRNTNLFGISSFGLDSSPKRKKTKKKTVTRKKIIVKKHKRKVYAGDFKELHFKQNGLCANPHCAKLNKVKQDVTAIKDLDHIISIRLWELMDKSGDPNNIKNLQLLCKNCHDYKTSQDRKKIAQYKQRHGIKIEKKSVKKLKKKTETKVRVIVDMMGRTELVPKSQARQTTNIITGKKEWILK